MPVKVNIKETNLDFGELSERRYTDMIIIHHTGSTVDRDFTAAQIHDIHLNKGWSVLVITSLLLKAVSSNAADLFGRLVLTLVKTE